MPGKLHKSTVVILLHRRGPLNPSQYRGAGICCQRDSSTACTFVFTAARFIVAINLAYLAGATCMVPVPEDGNVRTPALSEWAEASTPSPVIWKGIFGWRSHTYCVVAPDAG
jgi:hypothetical protein